MKKHLTNKNILLTSLLNLTAMLVAFAVVALLKNMFFTSFVLYFVSHILGFIAVAIITEGKEFYQNT